VNLQVIVKIPSKQKENDERQQYGSSVDDY
jgi:hypothetical protein